MIHVRAVDPAVPDWDLAPVHTTTTTKQKKPKCQEIILKNERITQKDTLQKSKYYSPRFASVILKPRNQTPDTARGPHG